MGNMQDAQFERGVELKKCLPTAVIWFLPIGFSVLLTIGYAFVINRVVPMRNSNMEILKDPLLLPVVFFWTLGFVQLIDQARVLLGWRTSLDITHAGSYGERAYRYAEIASAGGLGANDRKNSLAALEFTSSELQQGYTGRLFYCSSSAVLVLLCAAVAFFNRTLSSQELVPPLEGRMLIVSVLAASLIYVPALVLSAVARQTTRTWLRNAIQVCGLGLTPTKEGAPPEKASDPDPFGEKGNHGDASRDVQPKSSQQTFTGETEDPFGSTSSSETLDEPSDFENFGNAGEPPRKNDQDDDDPFKSLGI